MFMDLEKEIHDDLRTLTQIVDWRLGLYPNFVCSLNHTFNGYNFCGLLYVIFINCSFDFVKGSCQY